MNTKRLTAWAFTALLLAGIWYATASSSPETKAEPFYWHVMGEQAHMSLRIKQEKKGRESVRLDVWLPTAAGAPQQPAVAYFRPGETPAAARFVPLALASGGPDPYGFEGFHKFTYTAPAGAYLGDGGAWRIKVTFAETSGQVHEYEKLVEAP